MLYAIPLGLILGVLLRGRLGNLAALQFRWMPLFLAGLLAQVALFSPAVTERVGELGPPLYVASTAVVLLAISANWRIAGVPIVVAGAVGNMAAIVSNGGFMPAGASALEALGRTLGTEYSNSAALAHPNLAPLTDIFVMPAWFPFANIFSIGDVLIGLGVVVIIVAAMRRRAPLKLIAPAADPATAQRTFAGSLGTWSRDDSVTRHPWLQGRGRKAAARAAAAAESNEVTTLAS
jgi:hypothetical protein